MTSSERRMRVAMLERNISRSDMAREVGLKETTLGNVIRGARCSDKTRKTITEFLAITIWDDLPFQRKHLFREGTQIEFPGDPDSAAAFAAEFPGKIECRGAMITFIEPVCGVFTETAVGTHSGKSTEEATA